MHRIYKHNARKLSKPPPSTPQPQKVPCLAICSVAIASSQAHTPMILETASHQNKCTGPERIPNIPLNLACRQKPGLGGGGNGSGGAYSSHCCQKQTYNTHEQHNHESKNESYRFRRDHAASRSRWLPAATFCQAPPRQAVPHEASSRHRVPASSVYRRAGWLQRRTRRHASTWFYASWRRRWKIRWSWKPELEDFWTQGLARVQIRESLNSRAGVEKHLQF